MAARLPRCVLWRRLTRPARVHRTEMRSFVVLCLVAVAFAASQQPAPATVTYMSPVHMVEPVYDNSRPAPGAQLDAFPCTGSPCGAPRGPIGTNVVIDDDVNAAPAVRSLGLLGGRGLPSS